MKQLLWLSCAVLAACGGSVVEDTSSGAGGGSTTATAGTTGGPTTTSSATTGAGGDGGIGSVAVSAVGVGGSGNGGSPGVGGGGDGGFEPGVGGSGPGVGGGAQTSTGSGDPPIACGMEECDAATEVCCATLNGAACIPADEDCQGAAISCTSAAQCDAGEVCCGTFGGMSGQASCTSDPCGEDGPGSGIILCETEAECPPDVPCEPAPGGVGISFCNPGFGF